jgi:hypothetical protein
MRIGVWRLPLAQPVRHEVRNCRRRLLVRAAGEARKLEDLENGLKRSSSWSATPQRDLRWATHVRFHLGNG